MLPPAGCRRERAKKRVSISRSDYRPRAGLGPQAARPAKRSHQGVVQLGREPVETLQETTSGKMNPRAAAPDVLSTSYGGTLSISDLRADGQAGEWRANPPVILNLARASRPPDRRRKHAKNDNRRKEPTARPDLQWCALTNVKRRREAKNLDDFHGDCRLDHTFDRGRLRGRADGRWRPGYRGRQCGLTLRHWFAV
jgi:hypothetical protein